MDVVRWFLRCNLVKKKKYEGWLFKEIVCYFEKDISKGIEIMGKC